LSHNYEVSVIAQVSANTEIDQKLLQSTYGKNNIGKCTKENRFSGKVLKEPALF
jgi:hypothetical protein